jgi:hypothetical protein
MYNQSLAYDELLECSDMPAKGVCPWPKGTFKIDKCTIPMHKIPKHFDGEFRCDFEVYKNDQSVGGYQVFFTVTKI